MTFTPRVLISILLILVSIVGFGWLFTVGGVDKLNMWYSEIFSTSRSAKGKTPVIQTVDSDKQLNKTATLKLPAVKGESIAEGTPVNNTNEAQTVVSEKNTELGLGESSELTIASQTSDEYGNSYYQVGQYYKGVPIYGATSVLEVEQGQATVISGSWVKGIELDIVPAFDAKTALRNALDGIGVPENRMLKMVGYAHLIVFPSNQGAKLCWRLQAFLTNPDSEIEVFIVDAHQPEIFIRSQAITQ